MSEDLVIAKDFILYSPAKTILQKISFTIKRGQILLLLGANGTGKSTLLKELFKKSINAGKEDSTQESELMQIQYNRFSSVAFMPQSLNREFFIPLTLEELGQLSGATVSNELKMILPLNSESKLWNNSSGGERQRAILVQTLSQKKEVYLLDEPFNHLDDACIKELEAYFNSQALAGHTFVIATHAIPDGLEKEITTEILFSQIMEVAKENLNA